MEQRTRFEFEVIVYPSYSTNKYDNALHASSCTVCQLSVLALVFCTSICCHIYVQPKGLRMSQQMQSSER